MPLIAEDAAKTDERVAGLAARYGDDADAYGDHWAPVLLPLTKALLDRLPLADARLVVDVGTGVGAAIPEIETRAPKARVIGVDRSIGMLRLAGGVPVRVVMDASRLALASDVADVVVAAFMLFHLPDPVAGLREMRRVTRPGGTLGITTWGTDADAPGWTIWEEELDASGAPKRDSSKQISNQEAMNTPGKLRSLLRKGGFSAVQVDSRPLGYQPDLETFMELEIRLNSRERLASLPAAAQKACIDRAEERLRELDPADLADPSEVLLATATA